MEKIEEKSKTHEVEEEEVNKGHRSSSLDGSSGEPSISSRNEDESKKKEEILEAQPSIYTSTKSKRAYCALWVQQTRTLQE